MMEQLFLSGRIVDIIVALVVVEAMALALFHALTGRGLALRAVAANLAAGLLLMLALRAALVDAHWTWIAALLAAALLAHVADLGSRLAGRSGASTAGNRIARVHIP